MEPTLTLTEHPDPALRDVIFRNFDAHAASKDVPTDFRPLAIEVRRAGVLLGGLQGRTGRGWLNVEILALPLAEHGAGLGRQIMVAAEAEAVLRGCHGAFLNTIAFQAPGFYETLGYREFGRLVDPDPRLSRIWFSKRLL